MNETEGKSVINSDKKGIDLPQRKRNRLKNHKYSTVGAYFITICSQDRENVFSEIVRIGDGSPVPLSCKKTLPLSDECHHQPVGAIIDRPYYCPKLTEIGIIVDNAIRHIPDAYPSISVDEYVIMPDHIHILMQIHIDTKGRPMVAPTISRIIKQLKGHVTKKLGYSIWQRSFYDHVIRNREDYAEKAKYICDNPMKWYFEKMSEK